MNRLLLVLLTMMICWGASAHGEESSPALTLMVYLCGSDLETSAGAATADLAEMIAHYPADGSVRVLVMASGAQKWHNGISSGETAIYELTDQGLEKASALPLQSMGAPQTLGALLDFGYAQAPAEKYALILWNHGAGPLLGMCFDEQFSDGAGMDGLTLTELADALAASPAAEKKLAWIGFDACLMASVETACTVAPYAEYMIASQDTEPASGWAYSFLEQAGRDASGAETGRRIIEAYFTSLGDTLAPATLSCVDLSVMEDINREMNLLFDGLHLNLDSRSYPDFAACRVNTKSVGCSTSFEYDLVDLVDLLEVYQADELAECGTLLALLDEAIVASRSNTEYINGLNIHYPHYGSELETPAVASEGYSAFMADMSAIRLGKPLTDWSQRYRPEAARADGATIVTMELTPEQAAHLGSARLYIFKEMRGNDYQLIYQTDDVTLTEDNVLVATYDNQALFLVDAQGNVISQSIPYSLTEDGVVLPCLLWKEDILAEDAIISARAIFRQDEEGVYHFAELLEVTDDPALQGKVTVNLADYCWLTVASNSHCPAYDENGELLPTRFWTKGDYTYGWEITLADQPGWSVAFHSLQDNDNRAALLQLTDTQNNLICSELLPIDNPNVTAQEVERTLLMENEYCRVYFTGTQLVAGNYPQLRLLMECENLYSENISVNAQFLQMDETIVSLYPGGSAQVEPGTAKKFHLEISAYDLAEVGVQGAQKMSMDLRVLLNYLDEVSRERVATDFPVDLSSLVPEIVAHETAATAQLDGMEMTLYDLKVAGDKVTGGLSIYNPTEDEWALRAGFGVYINDVYLNSSALVNASDIKVPAGVTLHTEVKVSLTEEPLFVERPTLHGGMLEEIGVTEIKSLDVTFLYDLFGEELRAKFILQEPVLLQNTHDSRVDDWHLLYDKDGVSVWLMDITWRPENDSRNINLCFRNSTEQMTEFYIPLFSWPENGIELECYVNGIELSYLFVPGEIEPHTIGYERAEYTAMEGCQDIREIVLTFTMRDEDGRSDKVRSVIVPLSEPQEAEGFFIYEAEQLQVTTEIMGK